MDRCCMYFSINCAMVIVLNVCLFTRLLRELYDVHTYVRTYVHEYLCSSVDCA